MRIGTVKTICAVCLLLASGAAYFLLTRELPPRPQAAPHEALGQALAEAASKLIVKGGTVTLIAWDTSVYKHPEADIQLRSFLQAAHKLKLPVTSTNVVNLDPLRTVLVPPGDFFQILRKRGPNDLVVSFLGPPVLRAEDREKLRGQQPRVVALCTGNIPVQSKLPELFAQDLVHAAIVSRANPAQSPPRSDDPRQWMEAYYEVTTAGNSAASPAK